MSQHPPETPAVAASEFTPSTPAQQVVRSYLAANAAALRSATDAAAREEPDAVHQMRVSIRRLRSALRTFQPLFDRRRAAELRDELSWLGGALGPFRESEVLQARVARYRRPGTEAGRSALGEWLRARHEQELSKVLDVIGSSRREALMTTLHSELAHLPASARADQPARDVLPDCLASDYRALARRAQSVITAQAGAEAIPASDADWHRTRIAAKRTRYAADAVAEALGGAAPAFAKAMSDVTDVLGEHQDAAQAAELAEKLAPVLAAGNADIMVSLGVVHDRERDRVSMARRAFVDLWPRVNTAELVGWLAR